MRYIYSVVRFVPSPTRGECVNLGLLLGSDETCEWALETVGRRDRARKLDDAHVLPAVVGELERLAGILEQATEAQDFLFPLAPEMPEINEEWLCRLSDESRNVIQYSWPQPVIADSLADAIDKLWPVFIVESIPMTRTAVTKHRIVSLMKHALTKRPLARKHVLQRVTLKTPHSHAGIDFAVRNGKVVHMTQCWSFQVQDKEQLLTDVKAWAWTIRDVRLNGGTVTAASKSLVVEPAVAVSAVYAPPSEGEDAELHEAFDAFNDKDVDVNCVEMTKVGDVADLAVKKLGIGREQPKS